MELYILIFTGSSARFSINSQRLSDASISMDIETSVMRIETPSYLNSLKSGSSGKTQRK